jgi:hypothetical protein
MEKKQETGKFSIEEQVMLGDYIHDCKSAIIIIAKEVTDDEGNLLAITRSDEADELVDMLTQVMIGNKNLAILFKTALMRFELHQFVENIKDEE